MNPRATMLKDSDIRGMLLFNSQPVGRTAHTDCTEKVHNDGLSHWSA